jgi:hypothetical protein
MIKGATGSENICYLFFGGVVVVIPSKTLPKYNISMIGNFGIIFIPGKDLPNRNSETFEGK